MSQMNPDPWKDEVDLDAIERLGEYVSDCRWSAGDTSTVRGLDDAEYSEIATAVRLADAEWIAHFDPPTVRAMVEEIRRLKGLLRELEWRGERAIFAACPICEEWQERGHEPTCRLAAELGNHGDCVSCLEPVRGDGAKFGGEAFHFVCWDDRAAARD